MGGGVQRLGLRTIAARRVQFPGASEQPRSKHTDQNTGRILSSLCLGWGDPSSVRSAGQAEMPSSYPPHRCGPFAGGGGSKPRGQSGRNETTSVRSHECLPRTSRKS